MLAIAAVDVAPMACAMKPYTMALYADAAKTRPVTMPPGATWRKCTALGEGSQVLTKPDSGGTEMCVFYEMGVDAKKPDVQIRPQRTGVAKSLPNKSCPPVEYSRQGYPGKDWFFLADNVTLPNAFKVKAKVEADGLAYLQAEKKQRKDLVQTIDYGTSPLQLYSVAEARALECRKNASLFQGRYAACFRAGFYNQSVRGGWSLVVAMTKQGELRFIESARTVETKAGAK